MLVLLKAGNTFETFPKSFQSLLEPSPSVLEMLLKANLQKIAMDIAKTCAPAEVDSCRVTFRIAY